MKLRKLIAILAAILMVASMTPLSVFAEIGGDFPWTGATDKMLIEEILERDGLIDGIWFPWMDGGRCGHNLTGNNLMAEYYNAPRSTNKFVDWNRVELDYLGADAIYRQIYNLKAMGYNIMAYAGSIYGEGVIFDEDGDANWAFNNGSHAIVSDAHSGSGALQLTNPDMWAEGAIQTFAVQPNTTYTITWWYKATTSTGLFNLCVMDGSTFANMAYKDGRFL